MRNIEGDFPRIVLDGPKSLVSYVRGLIRRGIRYVVESQEWVVHRVGEAILKEIRVVEPRIRAAIVTDSEGVYRQIVHFGSIWSFAGNIERTHKSNRLVATVFHGHEGLGQEMREAIGLLKSRMGSLDGIVTASKTMGMRLEGWGVPVRKLHVIPIGVDLSLFRPPSSAERIRTRQLLGIPIDAICIGSFQKDGVGWAEGLEPKLIKGPDIFLEVVKRLSKDHPLFVLLTGPARGYVIKGLEQAGIPYRHRMVQRFEEMPSYYHCLDLYLVTAREEGGPQSIPECMATGVPVVSTRVGMALDMIDHGANGILVDVEDVEGLVRSATRMIDEEGLRNRVIENGFRTVQAYDWSLLARTYFERLYAPLLQ